jgi:hypothetical protein
MANVNERKAHKSDWTQLVVGGTENKSSVSTDKKRMEIDTTANKRSVKLTKKRRCRW